MKISQAETRILIKHFKDLVRADIVGITATDARNTVDEWLLEIGQPEVADIFQKAIYKYQTSTEIRKAEQEYRNS